MWLTVANVGTKVSLASAEERRWLGGFLSYDTSAYAPGSGTACLYQYARETFPSGLVPLVVEAARASGFTVSVRDGRVRPHAQPVDELIDAGWDWLWAHQWDACATALRVGRGTIQAPTGSGKGEMACALAAAIPCPWLFLVHRQNLVDDIAARWKRRGLPGAARVLGAGQWTPGDRLTLVTYQTILRSIHRPEVVAFLQSVGGVIFDESQVLAAETFSRVALALPNAYYRIGLSGTPFDRGDGRNLLAAAMTGPIVYRVTPTELIELGLIAAPTIRMHACNVLDSTSPAKGDENFAEAYSRLIASNPARNALVVRACVATVKPALCFVRTIEHGRTITRMLGAAGVTAEFASGKLSTDARKAMAVRLQRGDLDVIVCNAVFQEGLDIPELQGLVIAASGASTIAALQRVGRGMRVRDAQGNRVKSGFFVDDFMDKGHRWFTRHAADRRRAYSNAGYSVLLVDR